MNLMPKVVQTVTLPKVQNNQVQMRIHQRPLRVSQMKTMARGTQLRDSGITTLLMVKVFLSILENNRVLKVGTKDRRRKLKSSQFKPVTHSH